MSKYEIKEVNCETGEETIREMTDDEIAIRQADELEHANKIAAQNEAAAAKVAILDRLGITAQEAATLLS
jgi:hypothetical protein